MWYMIAAGLIDYLPPSVLTQLLVLLNDRGTCSFEVTTVEGDDPARARYNIRDDVPSFLLGRPPP